MRTCWNLILKTIFFQTVSTEITWEKPESTIKNEQYRDRVNTQHKTENEHKHNKRQKTKKTTGTGLITMTTVVNPSAREG